ncbi:MAG: hypothetical protein A2802_02150 [Candidatus Woykebacteria bacterium RIFCSPHIGHO2_01_FULL_43_29]|nr:MAG: hypothetical protein A2802_02150 [Candidatus Woykebacteria bacterium RIFCSPHIGHO2_01_FULL_43_29]
MVRVAYGSLETPARMFILEARLMLLPLDEPTWSIQLVLVSSAPGDVEHVVTFREGLPQVGEFVLISSELRRE